jgi:hypothetical protein
MIAVIACAIIVCVAASAIGQAVLRLCGAPTWSWMSPAIGLSVMMVVAIPMPHVPGRATTIAVVLGLIAAGALAYVAQSRSQWPPPLQVAAGIPVLILALVPFATSQRAGILGVSLNNDMSGHLLQAGALRSAEFAASAPVSGWFSVGYSDWYPLGPHALVAALGQGTGTSTALAFSGFSVALPVLLGLTALGALKSPRAWAPFVVAPLAGLPFLMAAYFGQGAFKEPLLTILALAIAIRLGSPDYLRRPARWVPVAVVLAGVLSAYSFPGLAWPALFLGTWAVVCLALLAVRTRSARAVIARMQTELVPLAIGLVILVVVMVPQIPRLERFREWAASAGIAVDNIGNLAGPLPFREGLGIWDNGDFRIAGESQSLVAAGAVFVAVLVLVGAAWALWRREWMLPLATLCGLGIWGWFDRTQSPYVAAKALVILGPFLMLLAVRPLVERDTLRHKMPSAWPIVSPVVLAGLLLVTMSSSWQALASSQVGPLDLADEIATTHDVTGDAATLYLGNDDFTPVMFGTTPVSSPVIGFPVLPIRTDNPWKYGEAYDIDSLDASTLNRFRFVVTPRDAASSQLPDEFVLVQQTASLYVFERVGRVPTREVLPEHGAGGALLDCNSPRGRRIVRQGGIAAIRPTTVSVPGPTGLPPGSMATVTLPLAQGTWDLVASYLSPRPVDVAGPDLNVVLPPRLSRPGPRWPIGRITTTSSAPTVLQFTQRTTRLTPATATAYIPTVTAVRVGDDRIVPVAQACGQIIDWYRTPTASTPR